MAEFRKFDDRDRDRDRGDRDREGEGNAPVEQKPNLNADGTPSAYKLARRSSTRKVYIDYRQTEDLRRFLTPNGKIQSRKRTGLDAREQRMVAQAVKRARYMALLPFTSATL